MNPTMTPQAPQMPGTAPAAGPSNVDPSQFGNYSDWAKGELAKGFTADQLHQHLNSSGAKVDQPHSGNWLTHLLPTIGSMAIPALGALLAPETGGLSLVAAAGLSGLGSAGGKAIENATEGKGIGDDVATAGIEGGVGGAVGGIGGKLLGKGASMLGGAAEKMAGEKAAQTAAEDAIEKAANTYGGVGTKLQGKLGAKDALDHVSNMGYDIGDPANLVHVSNTSNDVLNDTLNKALADHGPVDLSHYNQIIKDALAKRGGTIGAFDKVALARGRLGYANTPAASLLQQLEDMGAGVAKSNADPNEIRTLIGSIGKAAENARPVRNAEGVIDPVKQALYDAHNDVYGQVKKALYDRPELNKTLTDMTGNLVPDEANGITPQLAEHLNNVITGSGKNGKPAAQDLLDELSRNIDISKLGQEGQKVGQVVTGTAGKARAAAEAGLGNPGTDTHPMLDMAGMAAGAGTGNLLTTAVKGAAHIAQNPAILSTLSRIGALGSKLAPAAGAAVATSPNLAADPVSAGIMPGGTMGGTMNNQPGGMAASGTTDPNSMASILSQYMRMGTVDPYLLSSTTPLVQALAPEAQKQQLLQTSMQGLPQGYANAGGAQGMGGILSHISGLIPGTAAHSYQQQQQATAQQLAHTLGISPEAAMGLMPQLMQNQSSAGISQGILGNMSGQLAY